MTDSAQLFHATDTGALTLATELVREGQLVIIPTETIFGLTADATNPKAVSALFSLKGRETSQVAAVYLADSDSISRYAHIDTPLAHRLIAEYLPGPLTVILRSKKTDWPGVVSSDGKAGIRVSSESFVHDLVVDCARPLIATSANLSGEADCSTVEELSKKFGSSVPMIVYSQKSISPVASTVIDLTGARPRIVRQGTVNLKERLAAILREA